jgi:predicted transcriptional regulator
MMDVKASLAEMAAQIVAAYVGKNRVEPSELPALLQSVYAALNDLAQDAGEPAKSALFPAVPIKKSITPDFIICLEDGKRFKSLKRHLKTQYDMTPDQYRAKWGLPGDYPMVSPNYAKARSQLARRMGLGRSRPGT